MDTCALLGDYGNEIKLKGNIHLLITLLRWQLYF